MTIYPGSDGEYRWITVQWDWLGENAGWSWGSDRYNHFPNFGLILFGLQIFGLEIFKEGGFHVSILGFWWIH